MGSRRPLLLVGAGGFARETVELVRQISIADPDHGYELVGVLDDDESRHGTTLGGVPVVGPLAAVHDHDAWAVVCIGNPGNYVARAQVVDRLDLDPDRYATLTHPTVVGVDASTVGHGSVLGALTVLTADVTVGAHVVVMPGVIFTHDDVIEDFCTFGAGVRVAGAASVRSGAYVGSAAVVREGVEVGRWSLVGAGSVLTRSIPPGEVWAGNPARRLRDVERVGDLAARLQP